MQVETYMFGKVEVDSNRVITFPNGLVAFEDNKRFMLIHEEREGSPVSYTLQSIDDPNVAFQIIEPAAIGFNYELLLNDQESNLLQNPQPADVTIMLILFRQADGSDSTISANIRAPIIINTAQRVGMQKVIEHPRPNITISNLSSAV